jgi:hypothetical protein
MGSQAAQSQRGDEMIDIRIRIVAIAGSLLVLAFVIELVRRRRLKEEYSLLWIVTGVVLLVLSAWFELLRFITDALGAIAPASTLFFFGLAFVILMLLHFSVRVSELERRVIGLAQELALLAGERRRDGSPEQADSDVAPAERGR